MTPEEFQRSLQKERPAPVYLFIGPEAYQREQCRKLLLETTLTPEERQDGFIRYDLDDCELAAILDDARSFSLFATRRVIWVGSAEGALPRRITKDEDDDGGSKDTAAGMLADYLRNPNPDVVLVFDSSRYEFDGDDKAKIQRVQKFYSAIHSQVEFQRLNPYQARKIAEDEARRAKLKIGGPELDMLVEVLGSDVSRIVSELEKLALYAGTDRPITTDDLLSMVPNARATTIFALVGALGRSDRRTALDLLDILVKEGEYLPLALTFLATQFRLALVAKEAGLTNAGQIQAHFSKQGVPMWRSRAEQVQQTVAAFSKDELRQALQLIFSADRGMRDARPDDRMVMEHFVLALT
jgi:DNA polymerase-3 subunit delta